MTPDPALLPVWTRTTPERTSSTINTKFGGAVGVGMAVEVGFGVIVTTVIVGTGLGIAAIVSSAPSPMPSLASLASSSEPASVSSMASLMGGGSFGGSVIVDGLRKTAKGWNDFELVK